MKRAWPTVLVTLGALAGLAALVGLSGVYSIAASRGHWAPTRWVLEIGMRRSIETHALGVEAPPDLERPDLVMRGAGHFQGACAPCHGGPGERASAVTRNMLPQPPDLPSRVGSWSDAELFWIVKNGLKYTGMPGWPAQGRDDEVWAAVAFLRQLPNLTVDEYRRLAIGEAADAPALQEGLVRTGPTGEGIAACARCHGTEGAGRGGVYPRLAGLSEDYIYRSLRSYAEGARPSGIMQPVATALSEGEMRAFATLYSAMPKPRPTQREGVDPELLRRGAALAASGAPEGGVPACSACHGNRASPGGLFPDLAGQPADYLAQQLVLWRKGVRGSTPASRIMQSVAAAMTDEQIRAASLYYEAAGAD